MIDQYRKEISCLRAGNLSQSEIHIKQDEITYTDFKNKRIYKRVFRKNFQSVQKDSASLPVAKILEIEEGLRDTEFVLEFVDGLDVFVHMRNNPATADDTLQKFDQFLADWLGYDDNRDYLESYSFDINPGNFIFNTETEKITKIDYLSDWGLMQKELCYYLLPFIKLMEKGVIAESKVKDLINNRFRHHRSQATYDTLSERLKHVPLDIS